MPLLTSPVRFIVKKQQMSACCAKSRHKPHQWSRQFWNKQCILKAFGNDVKRGFSWCIWDYQDCCESGTCFSVEVLYHSISKKKKKQLRLVMISSNWVTRHELL